MKQVDSAKEKRTTTHPTERTLPVSARPASSCTPRMRCSRMEETSVGAAFASAAYVRTWLAARTKGAGVATRAYALIEKNPSSAEMQIWNEADREEMSISCVPWRHRDSRDPQRLWRNLANGGRIIRDKKRAAVFEASSDKARRGCFTGVTK